MQQVLQEIRDPPRKRIRRPFALQNALAAIGPPAQAVAPAVVPAHRDMAAVRACIRKRPAAAADTAALMDAQAAGCRLPQVSKEDLQAIASFNSNSKLRCAWPLQQHIRFSSIAAGSTKNDAGAELFEKLNEWFLGASRTTRITSKVSAAEALTVDRRRLAPYAIKLANTICHVDHDARALLELYVTRALPKDSLLLVVDGSMSDETPLPMNTNQFQAAAQKTSPSEPSQALGTEIVQHTGLTGRTNLGGKGKAVSKVLQSHSFFGTLFRHPGTSQLITISGSAQTWLQLLDRTTGECLLDAERRRSPLTSKSELFGDKVRLTVHDRAGSNDRCERAWVRSLGEGWERIALGCEVRQIAGVYTKVFSCLVPQAIKGQIHFARSLNFGTGVFRFSRHLHSFVRSRLRVERGEPPRDAQRYKRHLLRLCLARGGRLLQRRLSLRTLPKW